MTSWVAIDFETANEYRGSPCAVAMVAVRDNQVTEQYMTLVKPPPSVAYFSPFCVSLHGITAKDVQNAPNWPAALAEIIRFANGRTVVAHNAAFDLGVIRDACNETGTAWPSLTYACTLVVARRTWPLLSYSLPWVAEAAGHELLDHHDPIADARAAAAIMLAATRAHAKATLPDLLDSMRVKFGQMSDDQWKGCRFTGASPSRATAALPGSNLEADPDGPFYALNVCFTGTLLSMTRARAHELLAEAGGQPVPGVSRKTDVLVIGEQDPRRLRPGDDASGKHQKAAAVLAAGYPIEVITEVDFLQRLAATEGTSLNLRMSTQPTI